MYNLTFQFGSTFIKFTKTYDSPKRAETVARKYANRTNAENYWVN